MNRVFIASSLDGYIADREGKIDFLDLYPMPAGDDMGYGALMQQTDAVLMGRKSFDTVLGFGIPWPYTKPVFVWSHTLKEPPEELKTQVQLVRGQAGEVWKSLQNQGFKNLYIDGGRAIQSFLAEDLIDEITITTIPVLLGKGVPLFGDLDQLLRFRCVQSKAYENGLTQSVFIRNREE